MRKIDRLHKHGDTRIVEKFAWLPITITFPNNREHYRETRWLEKVRIKQMWVVNYLGVWEDRYFVDDDEQ